MDHETEEPTQIETRPSIVNESARYFAVNFAAFSGVMTAIVVMPLVYDQVQTRWAARKAKKAKTTEEND